MNLFKKRKFLTLLGLGLLSVGATASTIPFIVSCSNNEPTPPQAPPSNPDNPNPLPPPPSPPSPEPEPQPEPTPPQPSPPPSLIKKPTVPNEKLNAADIGLGDMLAAEFQQKNPLTKQFIFDNFDKFILGDHEVKNPSDFTIGKEILFGTSEPSTSVVLEIQIPQGKWYDEDGLLTDETYQDKPCLVIINNFRTPNPTQIKNTTAADIGLDQKTVQEVMDQKLINNELLVRHTSAFIVGDHLINNVNKIAIDSVEKIDNNSVKVNLTLKTNSYYTEQNDFGNMDKQVSFTVSGFRNPQTPSQKFQPTVVKERIALSSLNLNSDWIHESGDLITPDFIIKNKEKFFAGELNKLNSTDDISNFTKKSNYIGGIDDELKLNFQLAPYSWYDKNGVLSTTNKACSITITGFKKRVGTAIKKDLKASDFGWQNMTLAEFYTHSPINNQFVFDNLNKFIVGDHLIKSANDLRIEIDPDGQGPTTARIYVIIDYKKWYGDDGFLGDYGERNLTCLISGFKAPTL